MIQDSRLEKPAKIKEFTDLNAWKEAHKLAIKIYEITKEFPNEERYSLIDQMRRCSSSVGANIAEGFGRQTYKEKAQYFYLAQGSLLELKNFLYIAKDVKYMNMNTFEELLDQANLSHKLLQGLLQKTRSFMNHK